MSASAFIRRKRGVAARLECFDNVHLALGLPNQRLHLGSRRVRKFLWSLDHGSELKLGCWVGEALTGVVGGVRIVRGWDALWRRHVLVNDIGGSVHFDSRFSAVLMSEKRRRRER